MALKSFCQTFRVLVGGLVFKRGELGSSPIYKIQESTRLGSFEKKRVKFESFRNGTESTRAHP